MKSVRVSLPLLSFLCLIAVHTFAADCHTGSDVTVTLTSPSGAGTYATPERFTATSHSSKTITGYVVYTNASGNYVDAYQNGNSTLDAWVILPLTSGGAKAQSVFVRAWNASGFCGDSSTLAITASGTRIPTPLAGNKSFNNADDNPSGWGDCGTTACAGGANPATVSMAFGQSPDQRWQRQRVILRDWTKQCQWPLLLQGRCSRLLQQFSVGLLVSSLQQHSN